jgi:hypothetical protein
MNPFVKKISGVALGLAAAAVPFASQAHHAFAAEFDAAKPVKLQGVITKVRFVNPHSWIYLDVKNPDGTVANWGLEFGTPSSLETAGLTKEDVHPGAVVTIAGFKAKNGGNFGYSVQVTLPGGRTVHTGSAPDAPKAGGV